MKKVYLLTTLTFIMMNILPSIAEDGSYSCHVKSVNNGDTFTCENGIFTKIWGIKVPDVPPRVTEAIAVSNGGFAAKDYLKGYILGETLICYPKGLIEGGNLSQCFKDLQVKTIDIADPLLIGGHAVELKNITKGYYCDPNRKRSH